MEVFRVTENVKKNFFEGVWGGLGSGGFVGRSVTGCLVLAVVFVRRGALPGGGRGLLQFFGGFFAGAGRVNGHWGIILWGLDTRNIS